MVPSSMIQAVAASSMADIEGEKQAAADSGGPLATRPL
jgi:hypothetical protein